MALVFLETEELITYSHYQLIQLFKHSKVKFTVLVGFD